jgi:phosphotransferase system IIA component
LRSIDIENFDLSEYFKLFLDGNLIKVSKESINIEKIKNNFKIFHKGESFELDDILDGKFSGRTIALGDTISVLVKLDAEILKNLVEGKHVFKIESDLVSNLLINFELNETNMNLKLDPNNM